MPLAALNLGSLAEDFAHGLAQALAAVDHAEDALLEGKSPSDQVTKQFDHGLGPLGRCLREPEHFLVASLCHTHA